MTTQDAINNADENEDTKPAKRKVYMAPRLVEIGKVSDLTQGNGDNSGSDFSYS